MRDDIIYFLIIKVGGDNGGSGGNAREEIDGHWGSRRKHKRQDAKVWGLGEWRDGFDWLRNDHEE